jgi:hypothetical protein
MEHTLEAATERSSTKSDQILRAYRRTELFAIFVFVISMLLLAVSLFTISLLVRDATARSLLTSTAVSLAASLTFTLFYAGVVERARGQSESRAMALEIAGIEAVVSDTISRSTAQVATIVQDRINKLLQEEATRLIDNWPELLPSDYFPPSEESDPRFLEKLGEAVAEAQNYRFRGGTARYTPRLLRTFARPGLTCSVLAIDPRDASAIQVYASDRFAVRGGVKPLEEYVAEVRDEIFMAIVNLFDLRQLFRIEFRTHIDHLVYRTEIVDEGAFVSFYVGDRKTKHPPTYFYTRNKGRFYFEAFRKDFHQSWGVATEHFAMDMSTTQADLERFLLKLGADESVPIADQISDWRMRGQQFS